MEKELSGKGVICIYINMMDVASLADFITGYSKIVALKVAPVASTLKRLAGMFGRVRPVLSIGDDGKPEVSLSFASSKPGAAELRDALELPEKIRTKGSRMLIVFDEFQEVAGLGFFRISQSFPWVELSGNQQ